MVKVIRDLPENVVGIEATGTVTRDDYEKIIIPEVERRFKEFKKIKFLYQTGEGFSGLTAGALWDDFKIGTAHILSWQKCAVVTDAKWLADAANHLAS